MPFASFMADALYHPEHGYYTSVPGPWTATPDFLTAPQVGPALGDAVAKLAALVDGALGRPARLDLVELGSGDGRLLRSTLTALQHQYPTVWPRLRAWSIERGASGRSRQQAEQRSVPGGLRVVASLDDVSDEINGLVYSNELVDAFPVHRVMVRDGVLLEGYVDVVEERLVERFLAPSTPRLAEHLASNEVRLREGQVAELCLEVEPWGAQVSARLARGGWLTIDYGHETATLYNESRSTGTLVCQRRFTLHDNPLLRPGSDDITAHVDFGNLRRVAQAHGFEGGELCSLRVFLIGLCTMASRSADDPTWMALRHLLVSEIGEAHRVMWLRRGIAAAAVPFGRARLIVGCDAVAGGE
jgi:SAM-dependent MidA family methyltransferase